MVGRFEAQIVLSLSFSLFDDVLNRLIELNHGSCNRVGQFPEHSRHYQAEKDHESQDKYDKLLSYFLLELGFEIVNI